MSRIQERRRSVLLVAVALAGVLVLGAAIAKGWPQITEFVLGPECAGGVVEPVSVEEAQASLEEQGFDIQVPGRASACAGVVAAAALEDDERHLSCILRRAPVYDEAFLRLPDTAGGSAHFVAHNLECFVPAGAGEDVLALEAATRSLEGRP
jgi:hypothetical protein